MSTIFTKIINGELPSYKVAEDDKHLAFLDIRPVRKGHTLVIPKVEIDQIFDLEDDVFQSLHLFSKRVANAMVPALNCERVGVVVEGLEVPHAHIHLVPISAGQGLSLHDERLNLSEEELKDIASKISSAFNA